MNTRELPLVALRTFSVAAEAGSVTRAAEVLGVTHSAVSKQIKLLEEWLGQALFVREGRGLVLSPSGKLLAGKLGPALNGIAEGCDQVRRHRGRRIITVEAPATFAMYWLLPKLTAFRKHEPRLDVRVSTRMTGQTPAPAHHDIIILRGSQALPSARLTKQTLLFVEEMTVITTPALLAREPLVVPRDITRHALLGSSTRPDDWPRWLKAAGINAPMPGGGHRFDHLFVAMQAMRDCLGSIVAPRNLLAPHLARGELVCPFPDLRFEGQPYIAHSVGQANDLHVGRFLTWLQGTVSPNVWKGVKS
jgi:LysR family transcriptional regulator, glycine cleavage system transcriptional activator